MTSDGTGPVFPRGDLLRIGAVLTLALLVVGSVHFARYDWTGVPLDRAPLTATKVVSPACTEKIRPYTTTSGRTISPVVVDEQQYMALVLYYRGVPRSQLQLTCLYDPFTFRSGTSWLAHWLPFEEGLALGLTNTVMLVLGLWLMIAALRAQGFSARTVLVVGAVLAVSWNVLFFGTAVLVDSGVLAAIALCWYLISVRRPWFVWPVLLVGYPLKETVGIVVPVLAAWGWAEYRAGRRRLVPALAPAAAAAVAFVVGVAVWRQVLPAADAAWPVTPDVGNTVHNLTDVISLAAFVVGAGPLLFPAAVVARSMLRTEGLLRTVLTPEVLGTLLALGICGWSFITVDLTPRLFWIGFPFAATLLARWVSTGTRAERLARLRLPAWAPADAVAPSPSS